MRKRQNGLHNQYKCMLDIEPCAVAAVAAAVYFFDMPALTALLAAAAVHELGHVLCLAALGVHISGFRVEAQGLCIEYSGTAPAWAHALAAFCGPAGNCVRFPFFRPLTALRGRVAGTCRGLQSAAVAVQLPAHTAAGRRAHHACGGGGTVRRGARHTDRIGRQPCCGAVHPLRGHACSLPWAGLGACRCGLLAGFLIRCAAKY